MRTENGKVFRRHLDEERRYFPEWAQRPNGDGEEVEADRNSYLAGGYAEEFGYCAHRGYARGVRIHDGAAIEDCAAWFVQSHAIHPGYPEAPTPLATREPDWLVATESLSKSVREHGAGMFEQHEHSSGSDYRSTLPHRRTRLLWRHRIALRLSNGILSWLDRVRTSRFD